MNGCSLMSIQYVFARMILTKGKVKLRVRALRSLKLQSQRGFLKREIFQASRTW